MRPFRSGATASLSASQNPLPMKSSWNKAIRWRWKSRTASWLCAPDDPAIVLPILCAVSLRKTARMRPIGARRRVAKYGKAGHPGAAARGCGLAEFRSSKRTRTSGPPSCVVLSDASYNSRSGFALVCPVTRRAKGYPFEVSLPLGLPVHGVVLADHLRSLDWQARKAAFICKLPADSLAELSARIIPLVDPER